MRSPCRWLSVLAVTWVCLLLDQGPSATLRALGTDGPSPTAKSVVVTNRAAQARAALSVAFGGAVEPETTAAPWLLEGDFNGDGCRDLFAVVRILEHLRAPTPRVTVLLPFGYGQGSGLRGKEPFLLAFAVLHGTRNGWQRGDGKAFLLHGASPILILNPRNLVGGAGPLFSLVKSRQRKSLAWSLGRKCARGDCVLVPTEASEGVIYWDGKTYRWQENEEGE